ncbi:MAG: hypothetical protein U0325_04335 [Polyangiales bacterium]
MKKYIGLGALLAGCGGDAAGGSGTVNVAVWGEEYIERAAGIPAMTGTEVGFVDGWSVRFTKFLVSVGQVRVGATGGTPRALPAMRVYNLHGTNGPVRVGALTDVPARRQDLVSFRIAPPDADSTAGNSGVTADDLTAMRRGGLSLWVEGVATKPGRAAPVTFRWSFAHTVDYTRCELEGAFGVAVPTGGAADIQLTVHGDHFFYDRVGDGALLRFDDIAAADRDRDNAVTLDELAAVDLTTLPRDRFDPGGAPNVNTLRDFVTVLSTTVGHYNGEGECTVTRR